MKIPARSIAIALAIAGSLTVAATAQSSAAPIHHMSIKAAPALTTNVGYRIYPYASYYGYPTYYYYYGYPSFSDYYAYPNYSTYSPYWKAYGWW
jgi:hypothetical protein